MNKFATLLVAALAIQHSFAANITTSTTGSTACTTTTGDFANCNTCDTGNTYCTSCKPGYQLANLNAAASPTFCTAACTDNCFYCLGDTTAGATQAQYTDSTTDECMIDNNPAVSAATYATAVCANSTTAGVTTYATPGVVSGTAPTTYPCYTCPIQCVDCRAPGASPTPPANQAAVTTCNQCADGYYLSGNSTVNSVTVGTACTACTAISTVSGVSSNSAFTVTGVCNKCVSGTTCVDATCTRTSASASGSGVSSGTDTTSYTFDVAQQKCVAKYGSKLVVAIASFVGIAFVTMM